MVWRHYEMRNEGVVSLCSKKGDVIAAIYRHGIVLTGRSRVFAGHYVQAVLPSGTEFKGEDEHSLRSALLRLASSLSAVKLTLTCSGTDPRWRESGLSQDTGWGYLPLYPEAVHMMSPVPIAIDDCAVSLDHAIREAVDGMQIGSRR